MRVLTTLIGSTLLSRTVAQANSTVPANFDLEFHLVQCSNLVDPSKDPNTNDNATRTWSHIGLYSPHTSQQWQYTMPQAATPYVRWEGHSTNAFFWADEPNPRGFVNVQIPAEAAAYKIGVEAGKVVFEGRVFPCQKMFGNPSWGGACFQGDYEYCAGYTMCHDRFVCRAYDPPLPKDNEKTCPVRPTGYCYPYWNADG